MAETLETLYTKAQAFVAGLSGVAPGVSLLVEPADFHRLKAEAFTLDMMEEEDTEVLVFVAKKLDADFCLTIFGEPWP